MLDAPLEGCPSETQKQRLEDWLVELFLICRKYGLLIDTYDGDTRIVDLNAGSILGIGLDYIVVDEINGERRITNYECLDSILDGVWPVDTESGMQEQRHAGGAHHRRDEQPL